MSKKSLDPLVYSNKQELIFHMQLYYAHQRKLVLSEILNSLQFVSRVIVLCN